MLNVQELVVCLRPPEGGGPELRTAHRQEMWQEPRVEDKGAKYPEDGQEGVGQACGHPGAPGRVVRSEWAMMSWNKSSADCRPVHSPGRRKLAAGPGRRGGRKLLGCCAQEWPKP